MRKTIRQANLPVTVRMVCFALVVSSAPPALSQENPYPPLPGEPVAPSSQDTRYLSPEEAANAAYDFAKQAQNPDTDKLVDTTIGVISTAYPPAGVALGFAWGLVKTGRASADPVGDAIKLINTRLGQLTSRVDDLDHQINALQDFTFKQANINRMRELKDRRERLQILIGKLAMRPTEQSRKDDIALEAQALVNRYLDEADEERDLWTWNDRLHVYSDPQHPGKLTGKLLPAAFKPVPTLEFYVATLAFFMTAIEYQSNGNRQKVIDTYGPDLMRHASLLSVRPYWRKFDEPPTNDHLPEWLMAGVTCEMGPVSKYSENGQCSWASSCTDQFALKYRAPVASGGYRAAANPNTLCTLDLREPPKIDDARRNTARLPANLVYGTAALATVERKPFVAEEEELQRNWGLEAMTVMADEAMRLAKYGTVREQLIGRFDMTTWSKQYLYAVNPVGELLWQADLIGEDRNGSPAQGSGVSDRITATGRIGSPRSIPPALATPNSSGPAATANLHLPVAGAVDRNSRLAATNSHPSGVSVAQPQAAKWVHQWEGPKTVDTGWQNFVDVFPAGYGATSSTTYGFSLFGLTTDGTLKWYRHDGFANGTAKWAAPVDVGTGWNSFKKVFAGGDGVMYAIDDSGNLRWYRYQDVLNAKRPPHWAGPLTVASGWSNVIDAFSGGNGVIYTVKPDGSLVWWRHVSYQNGIDSPRPTAPGATALGRVGARWEGPKVVGSGWQNFRKIFSPGDGFIYAVNGAGELFWYYHQGFKDGSANWQGPVKISSDWSDKRVTFPLMWGAPQPTSAIH